MNKKLVVLKSYEKEIQLSELLIKIIKTYTSFPQENNQIINKYSSLKESKNTK